MHADRGEEQGGGMVNQPRHGEEAIRQWLITRLAQECGLDRDEIDPEEPFSRFGLNSIHAVNLIGELEQFLGRRLDPALVWDHPSIAALTKALSGDKP